MILFTQKDECCGCTACEHICPEHAIKMTADEEGFLYPQINAEQCIECGLCKKVCAFQNGYDTSNNFDIPFVFAVKHKNPDERLTSRSGGMFIAVSDYILNKGGVVYGVGYAEHFRVIHKRATTPEQRNEFKGSKYVQSDLSKIFQQVKADLINGIPVLFSGTPCQTAGLNSFLGKINKKNLWICDIVCHGVPSPLIWKDYIDYIEKKHNDSIEKVDFRDKEFGWSSHIESFIFKKRNDKITLKTFTDLFYQHIILRPSCGKCKYTNFIRPSDITLADFWGIEKVSAEFNADNKGVSLVLINTPKGKDIFEAVNSDLVYLESNITDCLQPNLQHPSIFSIKREAFWRDYKNRGFEYISKKYGNIGWKAKMKKGIIGKCYRYSKRMIKKVI